MVGRKCNGKTVLKNGKLGKKKGFFADQGREKRCLEKST